jgi:hypothetical protein
MLAMLDGGKGIRLQEMGNSAAMIQHHYSKLTVTKVVKNRLN